MTDVMGSWGWTYDNADRLTQITAPNGNTGYGYDNADRRTSMTVSGVTGSWSYSYDDGNRLTGTTNPYSESTSFTYDDANRPLTQTNGNSSVSSYSYDTANRVTSLTHATSTSTTLAQYSYTYDSASNVSTRTDSDGTVTTFGYDNSDQLTSEVRDNSHSTGYTLSYTYDHNHNRHTKVVGTGMSAVTDTYSHDNHDKLTSISGGTNKSYGYDSNGNCTSVTAGTSVTHLTYDVENRVVGITYPSSATNSFAYNGEDLRTQKVDSTGTQNYVTDGDTPGSALLKDGNAVYTPGLSERRGSTSKFYHADALGSTRGITSTSQAVTDATLYDAFGMTVSRTGTTPTPFGFVGKSQYQTDSDSGLQLLGHRYYDPSIGRFLSSDPAKAGTNWYAYCDNNPLNSTDPTGLDRVVKVYLDGTKVVERDDGTFYFVTPGSGHSSGGGSSGSHSGGKITGSISDIGGHPSGALTIDENISDNATVSGSVSGISTSNTTGSLSGGYNPANGFGGTGGVSGIGGPNTTGSLTGGYKWPGGNSSTFGIGGIGAGTLSGNGGYSHSFGGGWSLGGSIDQIGNSKTSGSVTLGTPGGSLKISNIGHGGLQETIGFPLGHF